jgi:hypothetical protein
MRIQPIVLRLAALVVLLCSVCDYCAFDRYDLEASMSRPGPVLLGDTGMGICCVTKDLPDDRCLGCSPSIAPQAPTLEGPVLTSFIAQDRAIQFPIPEAPIIERPPRL